MEKVSREVYHNWTKLYTAEKEILENCRCIVPNFMNDEFISIVPY
jgi:hypothetical protein